MTRQWLFSSPAATDFLTPTKANDGPASAKNPASARSVNQTKGHSVEVCPHNYDSHACSSPQQSDDLQIRSDPARLPKPDRYGVWSSNTRQVRFCGTS